MKKKILILSYLILFAIGLLFSLKTFEAFFFNKYLIQTPDLKNLTLEEASILLHNSGLRLEKMGEDYSELAEGLLYSQIPLTNKKIKKGRTIKVWVSKGRSTHVVPDFRDMNLLEARVLAEQKGFQLRNTTYVDHSLRYNRVISTEPPTGSLVSGQEPISFLVSLGQREDFVRMPEIMGLTLEEARTILRNNQLFIGNVNEIENFHLDVGIIIETSVQRGEQLPAGSSVNVTITK